jgi:Protein of unknown function (DUF3567)
MQMLYNSDNFAVVRIDAPGSTDRTDGHPVVARSGYEIVDKASRREIYLEGALAEYFQRGVQALVQSGQASQERVDDFIAGFAGLAQQPLVLH